MVVSRLLWKLAERNTRSQADGVEGGLLCEEAHAFSKLSSFRLSLSGSRGRVIPPRVR